MLNSGLHLSLALACLADVIVALQTYHTGDYLNYHVRYSPATGYSHTPIAGIVDGTATIARPAGA